MPWKPVADSLYRLIGAIKARDGPYEFYKAPWGGFEDLILSKNDYQRIKKDRPAMAQIIRTLFLKYDVLFVGFGADDPHINDIMEEITYFFPDKSSDVGLPTYHVIWKREADTSAVQEHYAKLNRTSFVYIRDYSELRALFGELQT